jgi:hypothetical protein
MSLVGVTFRYLGNRAHEAVVVELLCAGVYLVHCSCGLEVEMTAASIEAQLRGEATS